jgi:hypothetical protein
VISAVATEVVVHSPDFDDEPDPRDPDTAFLEDPDFLIDLDPVPLPGGGSVVSTGMSRREERERLREANADLARALVDRTGWTHAKVNGEMNRLAGIEKISQATIEQLQRRVRYGESWLRRAPR